MSKPKGPAGSQPKESRRWLKRRVPPEQLYRLAPAKPVRKRFGASGWNDYFRKFAQGWWAWLALAYVLERNGLWYVALIAAGGSFFFYHTVAKTHPAVYPLESNLDVASDEFQNTIEGVTGMPFLEGNRVEVYQNGDTFYPAMLEAIEGAQLSVTMEQYIFGDGEVGRRFAEAFAETARRGVTVKLLLDAIGSATLGDEIFHILGAGGCQVAWFRPIRTYTMNRSNLRDHRKSLIVDGRVAFTGGAGLGDHWLGAAQNPQEWRDTQVAVTGAAAVALQSGFAQNWLITTGEILSGAHLFPEPQIAGTVAVQTIHSSPATGAGAVGTMYFTALQCARQDILIANPYFIPDSAVVAMLAAARERGVTIRLMLAGKHIDSWWARQASVRAYGKVLEAGVEIYEFRPTMLHQKTMIIDNAWATIGTANFDNRSFALNEETNLCFHDAEVVGELRRAFEDDLKQCEQVTLEVWRGRGVWNRCKEQIASLLQDQM